MRPQHCISMPEHERNFLRLILVWKTSGMLRIKQLQQSETFDTYIYGHLSFLFKIADFDRLLKRETNKEALKSNQLSY